LTELKLFSGGNSKYLAEKIGLHYGSDLGSFRSKKFSDGEIWVSFDENIRGCDVFLVQSTSPPADNLMELLLMVDAARRASAHYVTVVVPYFGYARQDRKDRPRVAIAAKLVANLLSAAGAHRMVTCDLHAGQIQGFFDFPVDHLYGSAVFIPYIKSLELDNLVFAAPDVGAVAWGRAYAKYFTEAEIVVCDKHRKKANEIASMQVIGDVKDKNVVLVDDLVDTGGTLSFASKIILDGGAKSVRAACTHPVLSGNAWENIGNSELIELVVTDTIPIQESGKIKVLSVAELFAESIKRIHCKESLSSLFI